MVNKEMLNIDVTECTQASSFPSSPSSSLFQNLDTTIECNLSIEMQ